MHGSYLGPSSIINITNDDPSGGLDDKFSFWEKWVESLIKGEQNFDRNPP